MIGITDHLGLTLDAALRSSSRLLTTDRVNALMVFKSVRDSLSGQALAWAYDLSDFCAFHDHPVYIPRRRNGPSSSRTIGAAGCLAVVPASYVCCRSSRLAAMWGCC